jgi:uncharacterized protein YndB with AHSA1/START domain
VAGIDGVVSSAASALSWTPRSMRSKEKSMSDCRIACVCALLLALAGAGSAHAAVAGVDGQHLSLNYTLPVKVAPAKAYAAVIDVAHWWSSDHTYSGSAANLHMDARAGGCFCEKLPGGGVEHMRVVLAMPDKLLRLRGGLGPLQSGALNGTLTFQFKPSSGGTTIEVNYLVAGYVDGGFEKIASGVDQVLAEQLQHLQQFANTVKATRVGKKP